MPRPDDDQPDPSQATLHAVNASTASPPLEDASVYIADPVLRAKYLKLKEDAAKQQAEQ